jgi:hypothetical protein
MTAPRRTEMAFAESWQRPPASSGDALKLAQDYYSEGVRWLIRLDVAGTPEGRIRCATTASAYFDAGRLALAIGETRDTVIPVPGKNPEED